jgi:hypothetical protein
MLEFGANEARVGIDDARVCCQPLPPPRRLNTSTAPSREWNGRECGPPQ